MTTVHTNMQSHVRNFWENAFSAGIFLGVLAVALPFWLPASLGGDIAPQFVLTGGMRGELDPGSFVLARRSDDYQVGDIAVYKLTQSSGKSI